MLEIRTLWHFRLPLPIQMFIKVASSPRLSGIGMHSPILWSHLLKMQRIVLRSSLLWWELGTNSLITGPGEWLSFRRFTSKLSWSWSWQHLYQITKSYVQKFLRNICHKFPYVLQWNERWKKGEIRQNKSKFCFLSLNILGHSQCVYKIWRLALTEAKKFVTENLLGEKEKWTSKGNDKQEHTDSLLHNRTSHTQHLYQISKS